MAFVLRRVIQYFSFSTKRANFLGAALCLVVALIAHWPALSAAYVLDDSNLLVDNPYLRHVQGLWPLMTSRLFDTVAQPIDAPYYRPLSGLLYWTSYQTLGDDVVLQHALGWFMHGVIALLLFLLLRQSLISWSWSLCCTLCFALHPASVEIVAYASGRQELLGWLIALPSFYLVERYWRHQRIFIASCVVFVGSVLAEHCRECFAFVPCAFFVLACASPRAAEWGKKMQATCAAAALALLIFFALRLKLGIELTSSLSQASDVLSALSSTALRLFKVSVAPSDLGVLLTLPSISPALAFSTVTSLLVLLASGFLFALRQSSEVRSILILGLLIMGSVIVLHSPSQLVFGLYSDRYQYGFILGLAVFSAGTFQSFCPRIEKSRIKRVTPLLFIFPILLIPFTWSRSLDYRSEDRLRAALYRDRPWDALAQEAEGVRRLRASDHLGARSLCEQAAQARPDRWASVQCYLQALEQGGDWRKAEHYLNQLLLQQPEHRKAANFFSSLAFRHNDYQGLRATAEQLEVSAPEAASTQIFRKTLR